MTTVEDIQIDSDEQGWEMRLVVGEDIVVDDQGCVTLNIHGVAERLLQEAVTKIGPWLLEGYRAARSRPATPFDDDPPEREPGEGAMDYYKRTGNPDAVLALADYVRDARRGK